MTVTVSIINHNYGRFLAQAIDSALAQESAGLAVDVLIVDDGSTDCSDEILERYCTEPRLRISKSPNLGFGQSLSRAIDEARGEWVMLLDADDWFDPYKLRTIASILGGNLHFVANQNRFVNTQGIASGKQGSAGNTSTLTVRKAAAQDVLPVDDESGFHLLEIAGHGRFISEPLTFHRIHESSMASEVKMEYERRRRTYVNVIEKLDRWSASRPAWMSESHLHHARRQFQSMASFAEVEVEISRRARLGAITRALKRIHQLGLSRETARTFARAALLRPVPSRRKIYLE